MTVSPTGAIRGVEISTFLDSSSCGWLSSSIYLLPYHPSKLELMKVNYNHRPLNLWLCVKCTFRVILQRELMRPMIIDHLIHVVLAVFKINYILATLNTVLNVIWYLCQHANFSIDTSYK